MRRKIAARSYTGQMITGLVVLGIVVAGAAVGPGLIKTFDKPTRTKISEPLTQTPIEEQRPAERTEPTVSEPERTPELQQSKPKENTDIDRPATAEPRKFNDLSNEALFEMSRTRPNAKEFFRAAAAIVARGWKLPAGSGEDVELWDASRHLARAQQLWAQEEPAAKVLAQAHAVAAKRLGVEPGTAVPEMLVPTPESRAVRALARGADPMNPEFAGVKNFEFQYYRAATYLLRVVNSGEGFERAARLFEELGGPWRAHLKAMADSLRAIHICKVCKGTGERPCGKCQGSGSLMTTCRTCGGTGVTGKSGCATCGGDSTRRGTGRAVAECPATVKCTWCNGKQVGTPVLQDIALTTPCAYCDGTGVLFPELGSYCPVCCAVGKFFLPVKNPTEGLIKFNESQVQRLRESLPPKPVVQRNPQAPPPSLRTPEPPPARETPAVSTRPGTAKVTSTEGYEQTLTIDVEMAEDAAKDAGVKEQIRVVVTKGGARIGTALVIQFSHGSPRRLTIQFTDIQRGTMLGVKKGDSLTIQREATSGSGGGPN